MPTPLTDADKVIRNDTGKAIAAAIQALAAPEADHVSYDNTSSGLTADNAQDAIDELKTKNDTKMNKTNPTGTGALSIGRKAETATGSQSAAVGYNAEASGARAVALGHAVTASGDNGSFAEGYSTTASGTYGSHAEGRETISSGASSHTEGRETKATTNQAHAEGYLTEANGNSSHAEGNGSKSNGDYSHAEGALTIASGSNSHAEGAGTKASNTSSHAEGDTTVASGDNGSHAEGYHTTSEGRNSHSEGRYTVANHRSQHVFGEYNEADPSSSVKTARGNYVEIVGKGADDANRSNARTLDWNGNETLAGGLKLHTNQDAATLNVSSSIAAGATYDFTSYSDGTVIFIYRPADSGQSDYTGIYIRAGNWQILIPIKEAPNVTTSGYVLTNNNSQALRCAIIST